MGLLMSKFKASFVHLALSGLAILLFLLVVTRFWFPGPLFDLENVWQGLKILIPVDAVLGPLLTFIIYEKQKKRLKLDLAIIAALQLAALTYGGYTIYDQRPVAFSFVVDRFEIVRASENIMQNIEMERFDSKKKHFPFLTYVMPAQSNQERSKFLTEGINIKNQPERHYPFSHYISKARNYTVDLNTLNLSEPNAKSVLDEFQEQYKNKGNFIFLPLQGTTFDSIIVVIDSSTGEFLRYLEIDLWEH